MLLPDLDQYDDWRSALQALLGALFLQEGSDDITGIIQHQIATTPPGRLPTPPEGFNFVWMSQSEAELFLANKDLDPPHAADIVYIDTAALADAAVALEKIRDSAVATVKVLDAAILSAKIGQAAILTALIGDLQVVTAKMNDLAVNNTKIANLAVTSGKIANLSVGASHILSAAIGTAHIGDLQVTNAKIGNTIQSNSWSDFTKDGWKIDKNGHIQGRNITIYNPDGSIAFGSGSLVNATTQISGLGGLAFLNSLGYGSAQLTGFGSLAGFNSLAYGSTYLTGFGTLAGANSVDFGTQVTGNVPIERTAGFGTFAALSLLTSGNITTYIQGAAIGGAVIANAAIGTAHIDNLAVSFAKLQDASVDTIKVVDAAILSAKIAAAQILAAHIANAQIDSAHIQNLAVQNAHIENLTLGTEKVQPSAITVPTAVAGSDQLVFGASSADGANQTAIETGWITIGDADGGGAFIMGFGEMDSGAQKDAGGRIHLYIDTGGGYTYAGTSAGGARTDGGNTYSKAAILAATSVTGAAQVRVLMQVQSVRVNSTNSFNFTLRSPKVVIFGGKR